MDGESGSGTAVLVCQGRAVAQGRLLVGRFDDPTAARLLDPAEASAVEAVRLGTPPAGFADRMAYEMLKGTADVLAVRTVAIDEAVRERLAGQVVILGAGLDGRAWRMPELAGATVFEVDHPASQRDKLRRLEGLPGAPGAVAFVPVDFTRDRLGPALAIAGHHADRPTTWVWEGVVPYLTSDDVTATLAEVAALSAAGSRLVVNYQAPAVTTLLGRLLARAMEVLTRRAQHLSREPWRSAWKPEAMAALLSAHGFTVTRDADLLTLAAGISTSHRSLATGRVAIADR